MISRLRDGLSWIVTVRPGGTLGLLAALTIGAGRGDHPAGATGRYDGVPARGQRCGDQWGNGGRPAANGSANGRFVNCGSPSAVLREISQNFTGI